MTALSVWWRRNFGHRNDPPAMLPDRVRWTYELPRATRATVAAVIEHEQADGWRVTEYDGPEMTRDGTARIVFRREDGAYRWRDDSMRGF